LFFLFLPINYRSLLQAGGGAESVRGREREKKRETDGERKTRGRICGEY